MKTLIQICAILSTLSPFLVSQAPTAQWRLDTLRISRLPKSSDSVLTAILHSTSTANRRAVIEGHVVSNAVNSAFITGDKLIIFGDAGRTQAVEIFDIPSRKKLDWLFCYDPRRISQSLITCVEYYPTLAEGQPTDVLLVYDLSKTPQENRLVPAPHIPPLRTDRPTQVGIPIFPQVNVDRKSYDNHVASVSDSYSVAGSFSTLISGNRLVFAASQFDSSAHRNTKVIVVDLEHGPSFAKAKTYVIASQTGGPIDITDIRELTSSELELTFKENGNSPTSILKLQ